MQIGDQVTLKNNIMGAGAAAYTKYHSWFLEYCPVLDSFYSEKLPSADKIYTIVFKGYHLLNSRKMLCAIKDSSNNVYLVGEEKMQPFSKLDLFDAVRIVNTEYIVPTAIEWFQCYCPNTDDIAYYSYGNTHPNTKRTYLIVGKGELDENMLYEIRNADDEIFLVTAEAIEKEDY